MVAAAARPARAAIFLDRDGVINRAIVRHGKPFAPTALAELEVLPGVAEALLRARRSGFLNIVVTNQPDLATGRQRPEGLAAIHEYLRRELAIDSIRVCAHVDADRCECRKPRPGLLLDAARDFGVDLKSSYMVGDRWRDIAAAHNAGCASFFIDYGYDERRPEPPFVTATSLAHVADLLGLAAAELEDRETS